MGSDPIGDYLEVFGEPDELAQARMTARFEAYLRSAGEPSSKAAQQRSKPERDQPEPARLHLLGRTVVWLAVAAALVLLSVSQLRVVRQLGEIEHELVRVSQIGGETRRAPADPGPLPAGPTWLANADSYITVEGDGSVASLIRNDASGSEVDLRAGAVTMTVEHTGSSDYVVNVINADDGGSYSVRAIGTRFRVEHTGGRPEVHVWDGVVEVRGAEFADRAIRVSNETRTLSAALARATSDSTTVADAEAAVEESPSGSRPPPVPDVHALYDRAMALRSTNKAKAIALFDEVIEAGNRDELTQDSFEELRQLVDKAKWDDLRVRYHERFPDPKQRLYAEDFEASRCMVRGGSDATACWQDFKAKFPHSQYGG